MSRRESCVWHPMPDEVRRSSVQSRRASLAAGRRKQMQDEPDWEVEAPPTPPPNDYSPRQEHAEGEAAAAAAAAPVAVEEPEAAESREPVEEARHEPVEEKSAAEAAQEREVAADADAAVAASCEESIAADSGKRAKTRHTIRFRGSKWAEVTDAERRSAAFIEDVADAAALTPDQLHKLKFAVEPDMMVATFYVSHASTEREKMREIHQKFLNANFEHTCALYPE